MYFDIAPKVKREDLFGREYEADRFVIHLADPSVRLIIVRGLRRTGKTSLLNVALHDAKIPFVKIDVREAPYDDRVEFLRYVIQCVKEIVGESFFDSILKKVKGIGFSYREMEAILYLQGPEIFQRFFSQLDKQLQRKKQRLIIAFDEVQLLSKIKFDYIIAAWYDNLKQIACVLSGSEIGLLDNFLGRKDAKAPLFGRGFIEVETKKLEDSQTSLFLQEGFHQIKKTISLLEVTAVIEQLDGIIGWATLYGWQRSKGKSHQAALLQVVEEGSRLAGSEFRSFLSKRNRRAYIQVLASVAQGTNQWTAIKEKFSRKGKKVSDHQLNLYLQELQDYGFLEKRNVQYFICDPLLVRALE